MVGGLFFQICVFYVFSNATRTHREGTTVERLLFIRIILVIHVFMSHFGQFHNPTQVYDKVM